tara:strand:+ start:728 stop:955 length:228 start_codon:yes stop_codon:yes gene_type:complete
MKTIEDHIQHDKEIANDPLANPAARRHAKEELHDLEEYAEHHKEEIKAGDHHDPNALELFCDMHPDEPECLVYDD